MTEISPKIAQLDARADALRLDEADAEAIFVAADALASQYRLRTTLSDPVVPAPVREQVARQLFAQRLGEKAAEVVAAAAGLAKGSGELEHAVERQGVRAELRNSADSEDIADELFGFARVVESDSALQTTLTDPLIDSSARQRLVTELLGGRAQSATVRLAQRAVTGRGRTLVKRLDGYVEIAAQLNQQRVARVTAAAPLTDQQYAQLQATLIELYQVGIDIQIEIDPKVLGGLRIEIGDELIDGTIQDKLNDARRLIG